MSLVVEEAGTVVSCHSGPIVDCESTIVYTRPQVRAETTIKPWTLRRDQSACFSFQSFVILIGNLIPR